MMDWLKKYFASYYTIGIVTILLGAILLFYFLSVSFSQKNTQNEIVITYADNISSAHLSLIKKFNQINKGQIKVEPINLPFSKFSTNERKELLARSLRSKSKKIDLFAVDLIWSARFSKWSEPLDKYIQKEDTSSLLKQALESCIFNNEVIALPIYLDVGMMYYRKDLLRRLPNYLEIEKKLHDGITWNEFIKLRKDFTLDKNQFYIFPADNYEGLVCSYFEILFNQSQNILSNNEFKIASIENKRTLELLYGLLHNYAVSPDVVTEFNENNCYEYFIKNDAIFLRGWPSSEKDYKNFIQEKNVDSMFGKASLPHLEGSSASSVLGGWNITISKYSEHKVESFKFIKFLLNETSQKEMYEKGSYLPVLKSIYADEKYLEKFPNLTYDKYLLDRGIHRPFLENYTKLSDVISFYTKKVLTDELTIEEALQKAEENIITGRIIIR